MITKTKVQCVRKRNKLLAEELFKNNVIGT